MVTPIDFTCSLAFALMSGPACLNGLKLSMEEKIFPAIDGRDRMSGLRQFKVAETMIGLLDEQSVFGLVHGLIFVPWLFIEDIQKPV